jgi:NifU-like protein involved in Fe-S cluster formation
MGCQQATASVDYATDELIGKTIRQSVLPPDLVPSDAH